MSPVFFALTLTLSLQREREVFFEDISPLPPLLKRGGTYTCLGVFEP
jgi:hypothetical protein